MKVKKRFVFVSIQTKTKSLSSIRQSAVPVLSTTILQENKKKKIFTGIK
ncbi:hypothetical protein GCM10008931_24380 [Oceanobacillus oncorhynchi subsp. oncorhynchi]